VYQRSTYLEQAVLRMPIEMSPKFWLAAKAFRTSGSEYASQLTDTGLRKPKNSYNILI